MSVDDLGGNSWAAVLLVHFDGPLAARRPSRIDREAANVKGQIRHATGLTGNGLTPTDATVVHEMNVCGLNFF